MATGFLPSIFGQEVPPEEVPPSVRNSMAGQAAAIVNQRKQDRLATRQQAAASPPAQTPMVPQVEPPAAPQASTVFASRPQEINPYKVIARRPGGMVTVPTSTVIRSQQPTAEEYAANADVTEQQARYVGAQQELLEKQAQFSEQKANAMQRLSDIDEQSQARIDEKNAEKAAALSEGMTKLTTLTEEVRDRQVKNYWADKSTGSKILAAIGIAIGGGLQGMRGGPNPALQVINQAIEADLVKQKANIAKGFGDLAEQKSLMAETSKIYDSQIVAEEAARAAGYRSVANDLDILAQKADTVEKRENINILSEQVKLLASQSEQAFQQSLRADVTQQLTTKVIPAKTVTVGDIIKTQGYVDYNEMVKKKKADTFVPAYGGFARYGNDDAQKLAVDARDRQAAKNVLNKLIDFRNKHGEWNVLNPAERAYASALHNEFLLLKKGRSMADLGVLAGPDLELLLTSAPKPEDLFTFGVPRYQAVIDSINDKERLDIQGRIMPAIPQTIPPIYRRGKVTGNVEDF